MSTIQLLEAKFDTLEQRVIRIEADVASLVNFVEKERTERLEFQQTVFHFQETVLQFQRNALEMFGLLREQLDKIDERLDGLT